LPKKKISDKLDLYLNKIYIMFETWEDPYKEMKGKGQERFNTHHTAKLVFEDAQGAIRKIIKSKKEKNRTLEKDGWRILNDEKINARLLNDEYWTAMCLLEIAMEELKGGLKFKDTLKEAEHYAKEVEYDPTLQKEALQKIKQFKDTLYL